MKKTVLAGALLLLSFVAQSKDLSAEILEQKARANFESGNFEQALEYYVAINNHREGAEHSTSVRYNIAVCHYKLQQWEQAKKLFTQLHNEQIEEPRITYSLAVVEKNLGNTQRAAALFLEVSALSNDSTLSDAARKQYRSLYSSGNSTTQTTRSHKPLNLSIELHKGNDNNVLQPSDLSSTGRSDRFTEAIAMASWQSDEPARNRWVVDGFAYASRYDTVDEYDFDMLDIGLRKYLPTHSGRWFWGLRSNISALGGDAYLHSSSAQLGAEGWLQEHYKWQASYQLKNHRSLNEQFDPFAGGSHRLNLNLSGSLLDNGQWKLGYRYEYDDRDDLDLGDLFTSYSARRHSVHADWGLKWGKWSGKLSASYRNSDYMDNNIMLDGSSALRKDQRVKLSFRNSWALFEDWSLSSEYSYANNESNIEAYDFDRHMLMFGVRWDW